MAAFSYAHSLAKAFTCAGMTSMADLGSGLPREATNEDASAVVRAKGRHGNVSCNKVAFRLLELLVGSGIVVISPARTKEIVEPLAAVIID